MARALEHACQDKDAPQRTLPWGPNLPHDADGLAKLLFNEVARVGLAEMERKARSFEDHIPYLNRHRSGGPHPCDTATVEFEKAYLQSLRQQQGEVTAALQPSLVAMAESSLLESEARMQEFRRHYGVQPGARLPPPAGSVYAQRQESLRADAGRLLEAHQRLTQAKTPDERQARWREFVAVHAEVSEQHPMLSGMTPGQDLTLLESLTKYSSPVTLRRALTERIINAQNLRNELRARPEIVWEMEPLVEGLIDHLGLAKDDPTAVLARDKVRQQLDRDRTTRTLLSVASVGLVATGMVLGGPVGWGLGAAAAATDAADFGIFAQRFALHSAANRIDVDPHRNLSDVATTRGQLMFEALLAAASVGGFAAGEAARLAKAAAASDGARFFAAVGRQHGTATELATYAVFEQYGLLGDLSRLSDDAIELAAKQPGRLAGLIAENPRALMGVEGALSAEQLEARMVRLEAMSDGVRRTLRPEQLDALLDLPPAALKGIDADGLRVLLDLRGRLGADRAVELATAIGPADLSSVANQLDLTRLQSLGQGQFLLEGRVTVYGRELAAAVDAGRLGQHLGRIARFEAANQGAVGGQLSLFELEAFDAIANQMKAGEQVKDGVFRRFAKKTDADNATLRNVAERMANVASKLSPRAARLAQAAPELRTVLLRLEATAAIPDALRNRVLGHLEQALGSTRARFNANNLAEHLRASLTGNANDIAGNLTSNLYELEHALRAVSKGDVKPGSQIWLGVKGGQTVDLGHGIKVSLPRPTKGSLQDADVLYLRDDGTVQLVEVKSKDSTLWEKMDDPAGARYLDKFAEWQQQGVAVGQRRAVAMAFGESTSTGKLDTVTRHEGLRSPRQELEQRGIEIREESW